MTLYVFDPPANLETRMRIVAATDYALETRKFDELSVTDICKAADVCRSTFYRYFKDKFEIVQWHGDMLAQAGIHEIGRTLAFQEGQLITFCGFRDFQHLYGAAAQAHGYNSLRRWSERSRSSNITETLTRHKGLEITDRLGFQIAAYALIETTMAMRWMREGMVKSPSAMVALLLSIVPPELLRVWDNS